MAKLIANLILLSTLLFSSINGKTDILSDKTAENEYLKNICNSVQWSETDGALLITGGDDFCTKLHPVDHSWVCNQCLGDQSFVKRNIRFDKNRESELDKGCTEKTVVVSDLTGKVRKCVPKYVKSYSIRKQQVISCPIHKTADELSSNGDVVYISNGSSKKSNKISCFFYKNVIHSMDQISVKLMVTSSIINYNSNMLQRAEKVKKPNTTKISSVVKTVGNTNTTKKSTFCCCFVGDCGDCGDCDDDCGDCF